MSQSRLEELEKEVAKLQEQIEMLREAQAISGLGIWQYDIEANKVTWSPEVYRIYGLDPNRDVPTIDDIFNFSSPAEKDHIEVIINNALQNGESYNVDCSIITRDGLRKFVNAIGRPYFKEDKLEYLFGTISEITTRKEREQKLKR